MPSFRTDDMVFHMKTTLVIDDTIFRRLKTEASREGTTISALVESALRIFFEKRRGGGKRKLPPLPTFDSGGALVDVADRDALYRAMEG